MTAVVSKKSLVPVRLAPGEEREDTIPAASGSETAAKTTGILLSSVAACIAIATGVATPTIRSTSSAMKFAIIWARTFASALQLSYLISNLTPFSLSISASWDWIFSQI